MRLGPHLAPSLPQPRHRQQASGVGGLACDSPVQATPTAMLVWGHQSTGISNSNHWFRSRSSCRLEVLLHALTHLPGGRGPDLSRTDRSRRLVSGRASRLATLIPPARNGLRIGRTHLRFGASSKHCSGHVHPSSEASSLLKPSRPRLREPVPSRQTATEPRPACAPKPRSRCASGALSRS